MVRICVVGLAPFHALLRASRTSSCTQPNAPSTSRRLAALSFSVNGRDYANVEVSGKRKRGALVVDAWSVIAEATLEPSLTSPWESDLSVTSSSSSSETLQASSTTSIPLECVSVAISSASPDSMDTSAAPAESSSSAASSSAASSSSASESVPSKASSHAPVSAAEQSSSSSAQQNQIHHQSKGQKQHQGKSHQQSGPADPNKVRLNAGAPGQILEVNAAVLKDANLLLDDVRIFESANG